VVVDDELRGGVGLALVAQHQRVLALVGARVPRVRADVLDALVDGAGVVVDDAAGDEVRSRVLGAVPDLRVEVEVLVVVAEERADDLRLAGVAVELRGDARLRQPGAEVALDPVHRAVGPGVAALVGVVVRLLVEVLQAPVLDVGVLARVDLDDAAVVALTVDLLAGVLALQDGHRGVLLRDDERVVEQRAGVHRRPNLDVLGVDVLGT